MRMTPKSTAGPCRVLPLIPLLFLIPTLLAPPTSAHDQESVIGPYSLRWADTASPRDTLRTFLTTTQEGIEEWRRGAAHGISIRSDRYLRAVNTLDLNTTPHSDSWLVQTRRLLFLREILDRTVLPPDEEIPGDLQVVEGAITRWTIPDTGITIARIEVGQWRDRSELPFPEFADEERKRLEDSLDYPSKGSPDHRPRDRVSSAPLPTDPRAVRPPGWKRGWFKRD